MLGGIDRKGTPFVSRQYNPPLGIDNLPLGNGLLGLTRCPGKKGGSVFGGAWDRDLDVNSDIIKDWGRMPF